MLDDRDERNSSQGGASNKKRQVDSTQLARTLLPLLAGPSVQHIPPCDELSKMALEAIENQVPPTELLVGISSRARVVTCCTNNSLNNLETMNRIDWLSPLMSGNITHLALPLPTEFENDLNQKRAAFAENLLLDMDGEGPTRGGSVRLAREWEIFLNKIPRNVNFICYGRMEPQRDRMMPRELYYDSRVAPIVAQLRSAVEHKVLVFGYDLSPTNKRSQLWFELHERASNYGKVESLLILDSNEQVIGTEDHIAQYKLMFEAIASLGIHLPSEFGLRIKDCSLLGKRKWNGNGDLCQLSEFNGVVLLR